MIQDTLSKLNDTIYVFLREKGEITFLGLSFDVLATIVITIFIFLFGYILTHYYDKYKNNRHLRLINIYMLGQINYLIKSVNQSIDELRSIINMLEKETLENINVSHTSKVLIQDIFELGLNETFNSLIKINKGESNEKIKQYRKMRLILHDVKEIDEINVEIIKNFMEMINDKISIWNEGFDNIKKISNDLVKETVSKHIGPTKDPLLFKIISLINNIKNFDLINMHNTIIDNLLDIFKNFPTDSRIYLYYNEVNKCKSSYYNILDLKMAMIQSLNNNLNSYKDRGVHLQNIYDYFSILKFKFFSEN